MKFISNVDQDISLVSEANFARNKFLVNTRNKFHISEHPSIKAVFHSINSPPPAKNFDIEIIFYIHASLKKFVLLVQSLNIFTFCLTFR